MEIFIGQLIGTVIVAIIWKAYSVASSEGLMAKQGEPVRHAGRKCRNHRKLADADKMHARHSPARRPDLEPR